MHKKIIREDGSVIVLVPRQESKSVTWEVMFKVGSRQERRSLNGVSHFIEHMMFKGTKSRPSAQVLSRELDSVGAEYNAFTGKDHTGYYVQTDDHNIKLGIDMLSDMLHRSLFDEAEMNRERNVIVEELNMYRDNPLHRIEDIFEGTIFKGTSLAWEIGGPRDVIKKMPHGDLVAFKERMYYPGNMVIGIAGSYNETEAIKLINRYFPKQRKKDKARVRPISLRQERERITIERKSTNQVQLMLGFPGYRRKHKNADALMLLSVIMGGTMSSRLFISIRERLGLAYDVRTESESYEDTGYFAVRAGLDKARIYPALEAIKQELDRVKRSGITREEFKRAKANVRGRLTLKFEQPSTYLTYLVSQELLTNRIDSLEEKLRKVEAVKFDDIHRVARSVLTWKKANLALIGPFASSKKFRDILTNRAR